MLTVDAKVDRDETDNDANSLRVQNDGTVRIPSLMAMRKLLNVVEEERGNLWEDKAGAAAGKETRQVRKVTRVWVWVWDAGCGRGKARTTRIDEDASDGHDDSTSEEPSSAPARIMHEGTGPEPGQSWIQKPLGFGGPGRGGARNQCWSLGERDCAPVASSLHERGKLGVGWRRRGVPAGPQSSSLGISCDMRTANLPSAQVAQQITMAYCLPRVPHLPTLSASLSTMGVLLLPVYRLSPKLADKARL